MAWSVVRHALTMVFGNFGNALRVSLGPFLIGAGVAFLFASLLLPSASAGLGFLVVLLVILMFLSVFAWIAVSWHRFVLLEEYPGLIPVLSDRPILGYMGKSLWISLVIAVPMVLILALFGGALGLGSNVSVDLLNPMTGQTTGRIILNVVFGVLFSYIWFRLALGLPGKAIGKTLGLAESWIESSPASKAIFGTVLIVNLLNFAANMFVVLMGDNVIGLLLGLFVAWTTLMVGVSLLTTFYGHLVEGRDLM